MNNLLNLPILVLDEILGNLNSAELNNLRSTCSTLNSMVNSRPKYLKKIKMYMGTNRHKLADIVTHFKLGIYNVVYDVEDLSDFFAKEEFFAQKLNSTLARLKVKSIIFESELVRILNGNAGNLESLNISACLVRDQDFSAMKFDRLNQLNNLTKLKIKTRLPNVQDLIGAFVQKCPRLTFIQFPIWQIRDRDKELNPRQPSQPLINFIENPSSTLQIDFGKPYGSSAKSIKSKIIKFELFQRAQQNLPTKFGPKLNPNHVTTISWSILGTFGVTNNPTDLVDLDPLIYQHLIENDPNKLLEMYIAQGLPIYVEDSLVNFKLDVCAKFPNLKVVYLFAPFGFRDYHFTRAEWYNFNGSRVAKNCIFLKLHLRKS